MADRPTCFNHHHTVDRYGISTLPPYGRKLGLSTFQTRSRCADVQGTCCPLILYVTTLFNDEES